MAPTTPIEVAAPGGRAIPVTPSEEPTDKGLKTGALTLLSNIVIGVASTAPAYSLAATLGLIVVGVGLKAPLVTLLAFVPCCWSRSATAS